LLRKKRGGRGGIRGEGAWASGVCSWKRLDDGEEKRNCAGMDGAKKKKADNREFKKKVNGEEKGKGRRNESGLSKNWKKRKEVSAENF